jgi:hypothetical protein
MTLPPDYIDANIKGVDKEMLETFYTACLGEGGTADEVHLRGLRAVLARYGNGGLSRCNRLQQEQRRFREPERTILCDILANGTLLPDPQGTRYGAHPAPEAVGVADEPPPKDAPCWYNSDMASAWEAGRTDGWTDAHPAPVPVGERLPELRRAFEHVLNQARCMETRTVGNIELADRLLDAVADWALPEPQP